MPLKQISNTQLIPLCKIARSSQYTQQYLSLLVQRKKLRARRIGRNYFTTKEWFDDYLIKHGRKDQESISKKFIPNGITKAKKKVSRELLGFSFFVGQKLGGAKREAAEKVGIKPWVGRLVIFSWFVLILSIYIVRYSPAATGRIIAAAERTFTAPGRAIISVYGRYSPTSFIGSYRLDTMPAKAER